MDDRALPGLPVLCQHCGELPPTCFGRYENMTEPAFACDECCGHACEDGHCDPLPTPNTGGTGG